MPYQTDAEYAALLNSCNFGDNGSVSKLITSSYTETKFNEIVVDKHMECDGAANYFTGFFGTKTWADGQGLDEVREFSTPNYMPISNEYFVRTMKPCVGGTDQGACDYDTYQIPEGGRGTMPGFHMYKWGLETPRSCIAEIRHIRQFRSWAAKRIQDRVRADSQIMNMFYTMMAWKTAGHKLVLEYDKVDGVYTPKPMTTPRNPFRGFSYNYMSETFPEVEDPNNIGPLSLSVLRNASRTWTDTCNQNYVATGSRGEYIWELWNADDWFLTEGLQNPDFIEKIRRTMPSKEFAGYSHSNKEREVIENWAMRTMPWLPKLAVSDVDGGLIPIDSHEGIDIEVGKEFVVSPNWQNAPFALAIQASPKQGTVIMRPDLNESGDGIPILPITGQSPWRFRNDYDATCNKHLNKPYAEKFYEMGFEMTDPDAAIAIIHRTRKFHTQAEQFCDLNDVFTITPNAVDNDSIGIGCRKGKVVEQASFTETDDRLIVNCTSEACGQAGLYRIEIDRTANNVDFNSLGCACGSTVAVLISDEDGEVARVENAIVADNSQGFPKGIYYIKLDASLAEGECISKVSCQDATPTLGRVVTCVDVAATQVKYLLDSPIAVAATDSVTIKHYDEDDVELDSYSGTVVSVDEAINTYVVTSAEAGFDCEGPDSIADPTDIAYTTVTVA